MTNFELYTALAPLVNDYYVNTKGEKSELLFAQWLVNQHKKAMPSTQTSYNIDSEIAMRIGLMYRFAKLYTKIALEDLPIQNIDEFTYMAYLLEHNQASKSAIIDHMVHEKSTGTEVLKRLLQIGFIKEKINKADKRSKLVMLTDKGTKALMQVFPAMQIVSTQVTANLSIKQKEVLLQTLIQLEEAHRQ
jgi:MarR family transcriptional regulator, lower aerobic nicotinate degradation pathway regulator